MAANLAAKRQDTLNRFYTKAAIGEILLDQLGDFRPNSVLDLGAGEGSLSLAVVGRWNDVSLVTVDIDPAIADGLRTSVERARGARHTHHAQDVLRLGLVDALRGHHNFDLAVCNPPFFRPSWDPEFATILQTAELSEACPSKADVTAEILFLAQNLRMLRPGGKVALIVPDGLMTGWRMNAFRRTILNHHRVDAVVQLPNHSFHDTEARCFLVILTKNATTDRVKLVRYERESGLSSPIYIDRRAAQQRMDFDFHVGSDGSEGSTATLRQCGAEIRRGSMDTTARKAADFSTFHTTDFRDLIDGIIRLPDSSGLPINNRLVVAEAGDILMARVDRSLHQKVGLVVSGRAPITDCIYRVRLPVDQRVRVFSALRSPAGSASLQAITKGVSARLLGKSDLLDLKLPIAD